MVDSSWMPIKTGNFRPFRRFLVFPAVVYAVDNAVVAALMAPRECGFDLPDLASRMSQLPTYGIRPLEEDDRVAALRIRAEHRGLDLPEDTARFLLKRSRRDMTTLYMLLDKLDREALKAKRRLTIPFVRGVLEGSMPQ